VSLDGKKLAIKIQYPGVAAGIDADIDNLISILSVGGLLPKGMFIQEFVSVNSFFSLSNLLFQVARRELKAECDYELEAQSMLRFREILKDDSGFYVPHVFVDLSSKCVLTMEYVDGKPVDACINEPQEVRDYISAKFIELCLKELFVWNFMQVCPNFDLN
jgi:aarF domain-containing kinase